MRNGEPASRHVDAAAGARRALVVSSLSKRGGGSGGLGSYGYSYEFVWKAFLPLLERWGEVSCVERPESQLDFALRRARRGGSEPFSLSFSSFQDVYLTRTAPNVVFPFWEFPDVPASDDWDDPGQHWVRIANCASLILTASHFTAAALARAGVRTPVRVVPVPIDGTYFAMEPWRPGATTVLDCRHYVFRQAEVAPLRAPDPEARPGADSALFRIAARLRAGARTAWIRGVKPCLSVRLTDALVAAKNAGLARWREGPVPLPPAEQRLELAGVVYTTVLNPDDLRKNWHDLLSAFLLALADRDDATLVVKLVTSEPAAVREVLAYYSRLGLAHRSRLVLVTGYLTDDQMRRLAGASTYYLSASRAEGACLPLLDFLAAGRPAVSPSHTALADYFDKGVGFVVDSHPEPCAWPHDPAGRLRTTWHRIVWSSLRDQIRASYDLATQPGDAYARMGQSARERSAGWASAAAVWPKLASALALVAGQAGHSQSAPHTMVAAAARMATPEEA